MFAAFRTAFVVVLAIGAAIVWPVQVRGQRGGNAGGAPRQQGADTGTARGGPGGRGGAGDFLRGLRELPTGTAIIRGRVVTDAGTPIRRAQVRANAAGMPGARIVTTDAEGAFELRDLPAGQWIVAASKPGFVTQRYAQKRAFETFQPIQLSDGQRLDGITFALLRGGVIMGRLLDDVGDPVANARVQVQRSQIVDGRRRLTNVGITDETDDQGAFRLYGLAPGQYFVSATLRANPLESFGDGSGYAPTYYPGTGNAAEAQRVTVAAGEEVSIGFGLLPVRLVRISGTVVSASGDAGGGTVMLTSAEGNDGPIAGNGGIGPNGAFTIANVPPGSYVLQARTGFGPGRRGGGGGEIEMGSLPIVVGDADVSGISITMTHGASLAGTIVTEGTSPITLTGLRVAARTLRTTFGNASSAPVTATGTFQLSSLAGPVALRVDGLPMQWAVKSIVVGSTDVTDGAFDVKGTEQLTNARIVLTDRVSEVNGTVTSRDQPAKSATVVLFADDRTLWNFPTRYVRAASSDPQGQFKIRGLPPGTTYLAAAVSSLEENEWQDPEFLEQLREAASRVSLREGETKNVPLRLLDR